MIKVFKVNDKRLDVSLTVLGSHSDLDVKTIYNACIMPQYDFNTTDEDIETHYAKSKKRKIIGTDYFCLKELND